LENQINSGQLILKKQFIYKNNLKTILDDIKAPIEMDMLSIDIDGNDYYSYNRDRNHKNDTYDQLCIVRFSAPWCKACKATNVAWERMTTKLTSHTIASSTNNNNLGPPLLRFYEVVIGPAGSSSVALKDMLGVDHIPQGIIHHPSRGLFGRKVDLNRSNLSLLKKQLLESNSIDRLDTLLRGMD
jgi:hypothetical protein